MPITVSREVIEELRRQKAMPRAPAPKLQKPPSSAQPIDNDEISRLVAAMVDALRVQLAAKAA